MNRCAWSDLLEPECAHCGAQPGSTIVLAAVTALRKAGNEDPESTLERPRLPEGWAPNSDAGTCRCGTPTRDGAWLCDDCAACFTRTLADLGALDEELTISIARQRAAATEGGPRSTETGLPWHEFAADARRTLHGLLVSWVRFCIDEGVRGAPAAQPTDRIATLAAWLANCVHGLTLLDLGPEAFDEITDAAAECHRIVFWKRKNRVYLGPCGATTEDQPEPCPGEVYADPDEPVGNCDACTAGKTVVIARSDLEQQLDSRLYTAAEIAHLSTYLGLDVPREQVRKRVLYWHRHKIIEQRSTTDAGLPMFRYGEVRGRLYTDFARRSA